MREAAEPFEQSLDSVLHRCGGMAVAAGQFLAGEALDFEPDQESAFFKREPSHVLTIVQELLKKDFGVQWLLSDYLLNLGNRISACFFGYGTPRFLNRPAKRVSAEFPGDEKGDVGTVCL